MPLKLIISNTKDESFHLELEMIQEKITLGRDDSNLVILPDDKKVVSRQHAEIYVEDGTYYLTDKGSRNGTFINNNKLKPDYPYVLDDGSEFGIGNYNIQAKITQQPDQSVERTVFITNPFTDDSNTLVEFFKVLEKKYQEEDPSFRDDFLSEAFQKTFEELGESEVLKNFMEGADKEDEPDSGSTRTVAPVPERKDNQIIQILLKFIVQLIQVISKFRTEFVGATLIQTKDSLQVQSHESLQNYLFDPNLSPQDAQKRFKLLQDEIEKVIMHQVALLDGYRGSIQDGVPELLKELNPLILKRELSKEKFNIGPLSIPKKIIPLLIEMKTLNQIEKILYNLSQEDRGVFEKKYFRPAFIKRYLEIISTGQKLQSNSEQ
ncbi:MAG: FHA domain-containing protein [bacterium]|nr:MAG: FHA domain-containing protein [bacterium]